MPINSEMFEMWANKAWLEVSIVDALDRFDASRKKRCPECHGQVRAHRSGDDGMRAHFEHFIAHAGCSKSTAFAGTRYRHPKAIL
ncbi:hypothetical protein AB4Z43_14215 [Mesorhizobium sp. 2RAF45]|uniref:hypothetical protein n=1 Tax=Mesorhizobium sp. 2RAF45 TaxID=3233001 RepID=UPI003F95802C